MAKAKPVPFVDPEASLFVHAAVAIGTRLDEMIAYEHVLDDVQEVFELHQMRIAAKRLRYTMDLFQTAYTEFSRYGRDFAATITQVKLLQEHLGEIHDADVLVPKLLAQISKQLSKSHLKDRHGDSLVGVHIIDLDACQGLLTLCAQARDNRDLSFENLRKDWARLQEQRVFEDLRKLLRSAITDETVAAALHEGDPSQSGEVQGVSTKLQAEASTSITDGNGGSANEPESDARRTKSSRSSGKQAAAEPGE